MKKTAFSSHMCSQYTFKMLLFQLHQRIKKAVCVADNELIVNSQPIVVNLLSYLFSLTISYDNSEHYLIHISTANRAFSEYNRGSHY